MDHIKDVLADCGWVFVWIVLIASFIFALHDHKEGVEKIQNSTGSKRRWAVSRLVLVWTIPILAGLAGIGTQVASDRADDKMKKLDPRRQPISEMTAMVKLVVRDNALLDKPIPWDTAGLGWGCKIMLSTLTRDITQINASSFCPLNGNLEGPVAKGDGTRVYLLRCREDPLDSSFGLGMGIPVEAVDKVNAIWIQQLLLPADAEIIEGSVNLTINSSTRKVFPIPPQKVGSAFYLEITSVMTNGVWTPYK